MSKENLLLEYNKNVEQLKKSAKESGLSDEEISKIFKESFEELKTQYSNKVGKKRYGLKVSVVCTVFFSIFIYVLLNVHTPTSSIVLRNVQGLTYPALKIVRILSVPIIKLFPSLTGRYSA